MDRIEHYLDNGVSRVILGSAAVNDQQFVIDAVNNFDSQIAVGIDAKDGIVRAQGWTDKSEINYLSLAKQMESIGVKTLIFTDIDQDGTLSGPNLNQLDKLASSVDCDVIASGGVSNIKDIINLKSLNIYGAITGKAIYTGDLDLAQAIRLAGK